MLGLLLTVSSKCPVTKFHKFRKCTARFAYSTLSQIPCHLPLPGADDLQDVDVNPELQRTCLQLSVSTVQCTCLHLSHVTPVHSAHPCTPTKPASWIRVTFNGNGNLLLILKYKYFKCRILCWRNRLVRVYCHLSLVKTNSSNQFILSLKILMFSFQY
jgi:hypothetical protein